MARIADPVSELGRRTQEPSGSNIWAMVPLVVAIALVATIWLRFDNPWAENDTAVLTRATRAVMEEGTVAPSHNAYDHGFGYPEQSEHFP